MENNELKSYLMSHIENQKYQKMSLIELYAFDTNYYLKLEKRGVIDESAKVFFQKKGKGVINAGRIETEAFRILKYESIIINYLQEIDKNAIQVHKVEPEKIPPDLPDRESEQRVNRSKTALSSLEKTNLPRETSIFVKPMPINPSKSKTLQCYIYMHVKPRKCKKCSNSHLKENSILYRNKKHKILSYRTLYCEKCDINYLKYTVYKEHKEDWILLNSEEINDFEGKHKVKSDEKNKRQKNDAGKKIVGPSKKKKIIGTPKAEPFHQDFKKVNYPSRIKEVHISQIGPYIPYGSSDHKQELSKPVVKTVQHLGAEDFLIRGHLFRCMHDNHKIENITAVVMMISNNGQLVERTIPAGYCVDCNVYFILESVFQDLKRQGTICCRITEVKEYYRNMDNPHGMNLASESILRQYGYSVSQTDDLSDDRRRQILTLLIDLDIVSQSEIINYLDFFINQRKGRAMYDLAIAKWKDDRDFIRYYHTDYFKQQRMKSLFRK